MPADGAEDRVFVGYSQKPYAPMIRPTFQTVVPVFNVAIRTATLGTRFALVFILAKYLDAAALGLYGLFTAAIGYALLCFGLDLYVYTTREIVLVERETQGHMLKSQAALVGLVYVVLSPAALWILPQVGLPKELLWWFLPILALEHLNQEIFRLLIIFSKQITASALLFVRQGSWAIAVAASMGMSEDARNLYFVMSVWAGAGTLAAIAGLWTLRRMRLGGWRKSVDWAWITKGIRVSGVFLVATLSIRAIQTIDRFWLQDLANIQVVGAYVLFFGVSSVLSVFLDAAIFSFRYPELIVLGGEQKVEEMHRKVYRMAVYTLGASALFAVGSSLALPGLLAWIGREIYIAQMGLYHWIVAAMIAYSLGMVPHYALYAMGRDRPIIASHVAGLMVFVMGTLALTHVSRPYAVPMGVLLAMLVVLFWKSVAYLKILFGARRRPINSL
ncbi:lipopolysaccharide biosynthesis protein [Qipengyuania sp. 483]